MKDEMWRLKKRLIELTGGLTLRNLALFNLAIGGFSAHAKTPEAVQPYQRVASVSDHQGVTLQQVEDRVRLMCCVLKLPSTSEVRRLIRPFVLKQLKREVWIMSRYGLTPSPQECASMSNLMKAQMSLNSDQLVPLLAQEGLQQAAWDSWIASWVVMKKAVADAAGEGLFDQKAYEALAQQIHEDQQYKRVHFVELRIPAWQGASKADVKRLATVVFEALREGALFMPMAQLFCPTILALRGGEWGWVREDSLDSFYRRYTEKMEANQISPPLSLGSGYTILGVLGRVEGVPASQVPPLDEFVQRYAQDIAEVYKVMGLGAYGSRLFENPEAASFIETL